MRQIRPTFVLPHLAWQAHLHFLRQLGYEQSELADAVRARIEELYEKLSQEEWEFGQGFSGLLYQASDQHGLPVLQRQAPAEIVHVRDDIFRVGTVEIDGDSLEQLCRILGGKLPNRVVRWRRGSKTWQNCVLTEKGENHLQPQHIDLTSHRPRPVAQSVAREIDGMDVEF